jgi:hypothetical protein
VNKKWYIDFQSVLEDSLRNVNEMDLRSLLTSSASSYHVKTFRIIKRVVCFTITELLQTSAWELEMVVVEKTTYFYFTLFSYRSV